MTRRPLRLIAAIAIAVVSALTLTLGEPAGASTVSWTRQTTVNPPAQEVWLSAVSCGSSRACEGVGYFVDALGHDVPLVERWNGSAWTRQAVPSVPGSTGSLFSAVSCITASNCEAVGSFNKADGSTVAMAQRWNGLKWVVQTTAPFVNKIEWFNGVSCVIKVGCEAVGVSSNGVRDWSLAERWNGLRWVRQATVNVTKGSQPSLNAVSCVNAKSCEAVGQYLGAGSRFVPVAERWNGTRWAAQAPVNVSGGATLSGVSCVTGAACEAVGSYENSAHQQVPLAERWNGSKWVRQVTVNPPGGSILAGVSCVSAKVCEAVGTFSGGALAERWNGNHWVRQTTASAVTGGHFFANAVSCLIKVGCEAVGMYDTTKPLSMAERYRG